VLQVLVSVTERDGLQLCGDASLGKFARAVGLAGLELEEYREATAADVDALGSTWAKRLAIPLRRTAWLLRARKP
jgi:hypothetical protein